MSAWWFALLVLPAGYFSMARRHPGFAAQPALAFARTRQQWDHLLAGAGGRDGVRRGVVVDIGFIVLAAVVAAVLLTGAGRPWWTAVAAAAAALDLAQDLLLMRGVDGPSERRLTLLPLVTWLMYVAYIASALVLIWAFVLSRR
jgi:hypothetical protein